MIARYYIEGEASFPYSTPDSPSEPSPATDHLHGFEALNRDSDCDKDNEDDEDGVDDREGEGRDDVSDVDGKADNGNGDVRDHGIEEDIVKEVEVSNSNQISLVPSSTPTTSLTSTYKEHVYTSLPLEISSCYPSTPHPIGAYTKKAEDISSSDFQSLLLPLNVLSACWAARRLSIVGKHDRRSYCFTHSYGRLYDKSSGSLLWEVSVHSFILPFALAFSAVITSSYSILINFILLYLLLHFFVLFAPHCSILHESPHTIHPIPLHFIPFPSTCYDDVMVVRMRKDL